MRRSEERKGCRVTGDHYITVSNCCLNRNIKQTLKYLMVIIVVQHDKGILSLNLDNFLCYDLDMNNTVRGESTKISSSPTTAMLTAL